jgi:hypothetical protein
VNKKCKFFKVEIGDDVILFGSYEISKDQILTNIKDIGNLMTLGFDPDEVKMMRDLKICNFEMASMGWGRITKTLKNWYLYKNILLDLGKIL